MRVHKRLSKRVNSRQRNRIQKKVSEHHRKARKLAKQSTQWKSKKPKDLGIPNAFPFKEQVLAEREEVRRRREEEKRKKRTGVESESVGHLGAEDGANGEEKNGYVAGLQIESDEEDVLDEDISEEGEESDEEAYEDGSEDDLEEEDDDDEADEDEVMEGVETSESEWEGIDSDEDISDIDTLTQTNTTRNSKKPDYIRAILRSDRVLFVLDARAIHLTRSLEVEDYTKKKAKESFFVLNRAEHIPPETLRVWVDKLGQIFPAYPVFTKTSKFSHSFTPEQSVNALKSAIIKKGGTICVVGTPQVGKSSVTSLLKGTISRPRPTAVLKSYNITPEVTLIDTPALPISPDPLLPLLGLGKVTYETISDLIFLLNDLPEEYYTQLERLYGVPALVRPIVGNRFIDPAKDLLVHVARKFRRLGKNGLNLDSAAGIVGGDCLKEKIQWWIEPSTHS